MNNTSMVSKERLDFDPSIPEDERRFYQKAYPNVNFVRERKVHCTVCKMHIGTAPSNESIIRMHPILRVTHCKKCHEFYNSGEFSKGEDGSELYCRWCGQGGEVYCCSNCPFVFCKSCIISNLSRGVVADIEQNENWSCFNCAPKMLWPLRAQHWALIKFIDKQKKAILNSNLSDTEIKTQMIKDRSLCCKIKKVGGGYGTDSSDSSDISLSRLKQKAGEKRSRKSSKDDLSSPASQVAVKKTKTNDEVVCTPDVMSMLEPECQLTVAPNAKSQPQPSASSPKIMSIPQTQKRTSPPLLMNRNPQISQARPMAPTPVVKKTIVGPRLPTGVSGDFTTPVYHTINGYRIDLNSAAQQETVRLPNGKLIQVKRQGTGPQTVTTVQSAPNQQGTQQTRIIHNVAPPVPVGSPIASVVTPPAIPTIPTIPPIPTLSTHPTHPSQQVVHSSGGHIIRTQLQTPRSITVQNPAIMPQYQQGTPQHQQQQFQQITIRQPNQQIATIRYQGSPSQQVTNLLQNGTVQLLNGTSVATAGGQMATVRQLPAFVKQFFPNTPLGLSRNQLQNQIFSAMEICQHLMGKVQTLTNSNAYKTAKSLTDVKELYIHLSYLLTYAIGRFKGLQDSCLTDMRELGFINDANSLENGQLAAGMDMVRSGKITDFSSVDLDSFHTLVVQNIDRLKKEPIQSHMDGKSDHESAGEENENSKTVNVCEVTKGENYTEESEDDCLLVELGERKSDDECEQKQRTYNNGSNEDDDDDEIVQKFSTSYENDDDYKAPPSGGFTLELDAKLIELVKSMPGLWDPNHQKNTSSSEKNQMWMRVARRMPKKQASDAEEDEITIVEPQTDTINLDSDNDDDLPIITKPPEKIQQPVPNTQANVAINSTTINVENISNMNSNINMMPNQNQNQTQTQTQIQTQTQNQPHTPTQNQNPNCANNTSATTAELQEELGQYDFSKVANLLAGLLDVELTEGGETIQLPQKKPRKKTTNKPNPTLLKQKEIQERERLNNIKKNDAKLKMQVQIPLNKVEDIYEYAKPLVEKLKQEKTKKTEQLEQLEENTEKSDVKKLKADDKPKSLEAPLKIIVANKKETDKATPESQTDDKDESEQVVVVVLEDLDNSKEDEEPKNETEDNDETVEIIEREEESQESNTEEDILIPENKKKKQDTKLAKKDDKLKEKETEDELPKNDDKEEEEEEEEDEEGAKEIEEETEILIDYDNNTAETVQSAKGTNTHIEISEAMNIDTDPLLDESDKSLLVPIEIENIEKDEQSSPDSSHSSHNLDFNRVLGRTEVA